MKLTQQDIMRIRSMAHDNFMEMPTRLSWVENRGTITDKDRQAIAYTQALITYLKLQDEIVYYYEHGKSWRRA